MTQFTLLKNQKRTHDVHELVFRMSPNALSKPGSFILFALPSGLKRAYSIAFHEADTIGFLVKSIANGKGGSRELCGLSEWTTIQGTLPLGHFLLRETPKTKLLIGTGTGLVPLYYMASHSSKYALSPTTLLFGVRKKEDVFYLEELQKIKNNYNAFRFEIFLSQESQEGFHSGRITEYLRNNNLSTFEEFYICGSPTMVSEVRSILAEKNIPETQVFYEQY